MHHRGRTVGFHMAAHAVTSGDRLAPMFGHDHRRLAGQRLARSDIPGGGRGAMQRDRDMVTGRSDRLQIAIRQDHWSYVRRARTRRSPSRSAPGPSVAHPRRLDQPVRGRGLKMLFRRRGRVLARDTFQYGLGNGTPTAPRAASPWRRRIKSSSGSASNVRPSQFRRCLRALHVPARAPARRPDFRSW